MTFPSATLDAPVAVTVDASPAEALRRIALRLSEELPVQRLHHQDDETLLETTTAIEHLGRYVDALRTEAAAVLDDRSRAVTPAEPGLATKKGCRNSVELLERVTRVSGATAARRIRLGRVTAVANPRFRIVADAFESGLLSTDAASAIVAGLSPALRNCTIDGLQAAEEELVAAAIGTSEVVPTACTADETRQQALVWQAYLDPDGMEPVERRAWNKRGFEAGVLSDGLVRGRFALVPEVAAMLNRLFDAYLSPRSSDGLGTPEFRTPEEQAEVEAAADPRSRDQQRHDVIAAMVGHYARTDEPPRIGGAPPTVLVTVRSIDLAANEGRGYIDGAKAPVSLRTIRHLACNGGYQFLSIDANGAVHGMSSPERCFTAAQRRAIIARDGGCAIPGCTIPAAWCEIHHVDPAQNGGPTHTDNGILLCWAHHRTIETSGWEISMIRGAPHIKAPPWIDPHAPWRPTSKSPTMLLDAAEKRAKGR
jgi:5-methylcytosine-specific restriction protein A